MARLDLVQIVMIRNFWQKKRHKVTQKLTQSYSKVDTKSLKVLMMSLVITS